MQHVPRRRGRGRRGPSAPARRRTAPGRRTAAAAGAPSRPARSWATGRGRRGRAARAWRCCSWRQSAANWPSHRIANRETVACMSRTDQSPPRVATLRRRLRPIPRLRRPRRRLRLLIGDGRIPVGTRLPSERELTEALGVSRTTVTRAYAALRDAATPRRGRAPAPSPGCRGGRSPRPRPGAAPPAAATADAIDLNCAAPSAPPRRRGGVRGGGRPSCRRTSAGTATSPPGCPSCRQAIAATYDERGLPTDPDQIMVTAGRAGGGVDRRAGADRPRRPGAGRDAGLPQRHRGAAAPRRPAGRRRRSTPTAGTSTPSARHVRQTSPRLAYLIPDFQNPTGHADERRAARASTPRACARARTLAVVDEAHQALALDGQAMPAPVRGALARRDHDRQRQQELLGRPAARLGARAARADGPR